MSSDKNSELYHDIEDIIGSLNLITRNLDVVAHDIKREARPSFLRRKSTPIYQEEYIAPADQENSQVQNVLLEEAAELKKLRLASQEKFDALSAREGTQSQEFDELRAQVQTLTKNMDTIVKTLKSDEVVKRKVLDIRINELREEFKAHTEQAVTDIEENCAKVKDEVYELTDKQFKAIYQKNKKSDKIFEEHSDALASLENKLESVIRNVRAENRDGARPESYFASKIAENDEYGNDEYDESIYELSQQIKLNDANIERLSEHVDADITYGENENKAVIKDDEKTADIYVLKSRSHENISDDEIFDLTESMKAGQADK